MREHSRKLKKGKTNEGTATPDISTKGPQNNEKQPTFTTTVDNIHAVFILILENILWLNQTQEVTIGEEDKDMIRSIIASEGPAARKVVMDYMQQANGTRKRGRALSETTEETMANFLESLMA